MLSPDNFRPYQPIGIAHLIANPRAALFVPMGMGKSVITLTALDRLSLTEDVFPALILAPIRVARQTWPDEVQKWSHLPHLRVSQVLGDGRERSRALYKKADIYTMNYDNIPWLMKHYEEKWPFKTVVADESTRLKGFRLRQGAVQAQKLSKVAHTKVSRFINLTGTPSPNGLIDLWGQMWFLDQGQRLGQTFGAFISRWFRPKFNGYGVEPLPHAQAEIEAAIKDICLSLRVEDYFTLDAPIKTRVEVELPPAARVQYKQMERDFFIRLGNHEVTAFNAAVKSGKLLQLSNGAAYVDPDAENDEDLRARKYVEVHDVKINALREIIESSQGAPVLVVYHFRSDLERLRKAFSTARVLDTKASTIRAWNAGEIPVMFAHPQSAGHGIDLALGGNILVFFSLHWSLEGHQQIIERIGPVRQAQNNLHRPVYLYYIIAKNTMDEVAEQRLESKRTVQDFLLAAMNRGRQE